MNWNVRHIILVTIISLLGIACFPANPLVFSGLLETDFYPVLFAIGWVIWAIGMALVFAPMIMFPRHGAVQKGKTFVNTTRLVNTGIYAFIRHPQYLGGILSIFVTTLLWYPHWLFAVLGIIGTIAVYLGNKEEEKTLIERFGEEYIRYTKEVPGMNLFSGAIRFMKRKRDSREKNTPLAQEKHKEAKRQSDLDFRLMNLSFKLRDLFRPRKHVLKEAGIKTGAYVLDYGCGPGGYILPLEELVGQSGRIFALDIHPLAIKAVKKIIIKNGLDNVETICSECQTGLPSNSIDVTLLYDMLHDLEEPRQVLYEVHRVLKKDAILTVSDHHLDSTEIVSMVTNAGLFKLSAKGIKTYTFSKE